MRTKRVADWCVECLSDGQMNTEEIRDWINTKSTHGTTAHGLGNVLSKDGRFIRVGEEVIFRGINKQKVAVWKVRSGGRAVG